MSNIRLPMALCAAVAELFNDSHDTLNALFLAAGAPGPPPNLPHKIKWKMWLFQAGNDPKVDSLALIGNLIEEFMDLPPLQTDYTAKAFFDASYDPIVEYNQR